MNKTRPLWALLFFGQLALIVVASVLAATGRFPWQGFQHAPLDKVGHLVAYGGLAFFGVAFFGRARRGRVVISLVVGAALEELSQRAFPNRTFDLGDLAMNVIGILTFAAASAALAGAARSRLGP